MLKATIDASCYPVVRVESKEELVAPHRAAHVLKFDPNSMRKHGFLLYFQEKEEGDSQ